MIPSPRAGQPEGPQAESLARYRSTVQVNGKFTANLKSGLGTLQLEVESSADRLPVEIRVL